MSTLAFHTVPAHALRLGQLVVLPGHRAARIGTHRLEWRDGPVAVIALHGVPGHLIYPACQLVTVLQPAAD